MERLLQIALTRFIRTGNPRLPVCEGKPLKFGMTPDHRSQCVSRTAGPSSRFFSTRNCDGYRTTQSAFLPSTGPETVGHHHDLERPPQLAVFGGRHQRQLRAALRRRRPTVFQVQSANDEQEKRAAPASTKSPPPLRMTAKNCRRCANCPHSVKIKTES